MRSLVIIEVEHGEDTDAVQGFCETLDMVVPLGLTVTDWTVKVDLPECFVLEGGQPKPIDYAAGMSDTELAQELIDMDAFDAWLEDVSTLAEFYNRVMAEAAAA